MNPISDTNSQARSHAQQGYRYETSGQWQDAIQYYSAAIVLAPDLEAVHLHRGICYERIGDELHAIEDYSIALELDPHDIATVRKRAGLYVKQKQFLAAITDYQLVGRLSPEEWWQTCRISQADALCRHSMQKAQSKDYSGSIADLNEALQIAPEAAEQITGMLVKVHQQQSGANHTNEDKNQRPTQAEILTGELQTRRQTDLEAQNQADLDKQRQVDLEVQRQNELEAQRQAKQELRRHAELEVRRRAELEVQRQAELQLKRKTKFDVQPTELEEPPQTELDILDQSGLEVPASIDLEVPYHAEIDEQHQADLEAQKQAELEIQLQAKQDLRRHAELERRRLSELETQRQMALIAQRTADAKAFFAQGNEAYHDGQYDTAEQCYTQALNLDSQFVDAYVNRAAVYMAWQKHQAAIEDYDHAIYLNPQSATAYWGRGMSYRAIENFDQALADYNIAIDLAPNVAGIYNSRGLVYFILEKYELAITEYERALELDSNLVSAYVNCADLLSRQAEMAVPLNREIAFDLYNKALRLYEQALAIGLDPADCGPKIKALKNILNGLRETDKRHQDESDIQRHNETAAYQRPESDRQLQSDLDNEHISVSIPEKREDIGSIATLTLFDKTRADELLKLGTGSQKATFREGQEDAIRYIVEGRGRLLVVQKTGWGKSFVYFIATKLLREIGMGPALLISPLLALMRNQIAAAEKMGLQAATINSDNQDEWRQIEENVRSNKMDILLISPERLANEHFRNEVLADIAHQVSLLIVDEAHCISDWGHDFRPQYRLLERIVRTLPANLRVLATTATANNRVMDDLTAVLGPNIVISKGNLDRSSLFLQTIRLPSQAERLAWLAEQIPKIPGSGIVYTLTVRDAVQVAKWLQSCGLDVVSYSGETGDDRSEIEQALLENRVKAVIATTALGMGFDKPDLAFVIHYQTPGSVVAYYQQVGRAGRALGAAYGILLRARKSIESHTSLVKLAHRKISKSAQHGA